jgi:hypothetical protein
VGERQRTFFDATPAPSARRTKPASEPHHCHWPGCTVAVPPKLWGCKPHWYRLPKPIRDRIWATYRPGQERDKNPSPEYIAAARAAREWVLALQRGR